jgi:hypothetical protein
MAKINEWLSIDKMSGTGNAEITLTASSYEEMIKRTQSLVVKGKNEKVFITVIQNELLPNIEFSPSSINFDYNENTQIVTITSNVPWSIVVNGEWFVVDKLNGDSGETTINISVSENETYDNKSGNIVFYYKNEEYGMLNLIQKGKPIPSAYLDNTEITTYQFGGAYSNGITSNVPWTATVGGDWFSIDKTNGEEGYTNLSITINNTTSNREGFISFYYKTKLLCTLTIEQLNEVPNEYQLTYKTTDGKIYVPYVTDRNDDLVENWGSMNVISNTYKNGIGTIVCDHPIKTIDWYDSNTNRRKRLKELNLPEGLEVLNVNLSYTSLTKIIFPNTLKELEGSFGSTNITEVAIPQSVEKIGMYTFNVCTKLKNAIINTTCFSIGDRFSSTSNGNGDFIFNGCTSLQNVSLAEGTVCIPLSAFNGCVSLTNINLPTSIRSIGDYAFNNCKNLIPTFPNNLIKIGNYAFSGCAKIENIILPNSVRYVGNYAFSDCYNIKSVYMNAEIIGERVITGGNSSVLKTIDLGNRLTHMNGCFVNGALPSLESLHIPNTIKYADDLSFHPYCFTNEEVEKWVNLEYVGSLEIKGNDPIHLPQSLIYIGNVTAAEDRSQGDVTEQHIVVGNNVKYVGGLTRVYHSGNGIGSANNLYITFESTVPPQMGSGVDVSNITNSGGDWDLIKNWGNGEKSTIIEIKYETTDGSKITIPNLSDIWYNDLEIVEHTYGSIKIKNGDRGESLNDIFSDASSQKIKRLILPKECNYGLIYLGGLNGKDVYADASCDIKIDNEGVVTVEIDDDVVAFGGAYDDSVIVGGKETLMFVNGCCLETPKNLYKVGLWGRTLEDKFYTCKVGNNYMDFNEVSNYDNFSNFYINDKLFNNPFYGADSNSNTIFKDNDIEEFYRL